MFQGLGDVLNTLRETLSDSNHAARAIVKILIILIGKAILCNHNALSTIFELQITIKSIIRSTLYHPYMIIIKIC